MNILALVYAQLHSECYVLCVYKLLSIIELKFEDSYSLDKALANNYD